MDGSITRDEQGRITEGSVLNPEGKNGHLEGWQRYASRLQRYASLPYDELYALINDGTLFKKLSSFDRAAALQAFRIGDPGSDEHIAERERGNNRIEGKPKQAVMGDLELSPPSTRNFTLTFGTEENEFE